MTVTDDYSEVESGEYYPDNPTWQCPFCGKFTSDRTADDHKECFQAMHDDEMADLRAHVEGW